jgi:hypothetical protein
MIADLIGAIWKRVCFAFTRRLVLKKCWVVRKIHHRDYPFAISCSIERVAWRHIHGLMHSAEDTGGDGIEFAVIIIPCEAPLLLRLSAVPWLFETVGMQVRQFNV